MNVLERGVDLRLRQKRARHPATARCRWGRGRAPWNTPFRCTTSITTTRRWRPRRFNRTVGATASSTACRTGRWRCGARAPWDASNTSSRCARGLTVSLAATRAPPRVVQDTALTNPSLLPPNPRAQANAASVGTEKFSDSFLKVVGLSILVPNVLAAAAAAAPSAAPIISPLNTLNQWILAGYGMSNRQAMRRKFNIRGTTDCAVCGCFSFLCDGDEEMIDDFCCYLCCFPCAVCQETRHMRRYNLGDIGRRFRPYDVMAPPGGFGPPGGFASTNPAGGYAPPPAAIMKAETKNKTTM